MKTKVAIVGYGVVGKRVADAVEAQDDMAVGAIVDVAPTDLVRIGAERGFPLFAAIPDAVGEMEAAGLEVRGDFNDALAGADIVIDTSPAGVTAKNVPIYNQMAKPFIVNGGEKHELTDFSFSALANYGDGVGKKKTRVVSCNTTSLCRAIVALSSTREIEDIFVTIVRRGADPVRTSSGPINAIVPVLGGFSHHAPDVNTVIPQVKIASLAVKVSTTLSHVHMMRVRFREPVTREQVVNCLEETPRITLVSGKRGITSTAHIQELYRDKLRPRADYWEVAVWEDSIHVQGSVAVLTYSVHMEAVAVPENIDAVRAMLKLELNPANSIAMTDKALGFFKKNANYDQFSRQS